jgi:hypothetical protein
MGYIHNMANPATEVRVNSPDQSSWIEDAVNVFTQDYQFPEELAVHYSEQLYKLLFKTMSVRETIDFFMENTVLEFEFENE